MFVSKLLSQKATIRLPTLNNSKKMGNYMCSLGCGGGNVENYSACKYLVIGGGNSAGYLAKAFVDNGLKSGECIILSEEDALPYERPALSKAFLTNSQVRLPGFHTCVGSGGEPQDGNWYIDRGFPVVTGTKVTGINFEKKVVATNNGKTFGYQKLILATGCEAIRLECPGSELEGIFYLRNNSDGLVLVGGIDTALKTNTKRAVVIGGGYIGMEVAAALNTNGLQTTMVFPEQWLMAKFMPKQLAKFYEDFYKQKGIRILKGSSIVSSFEGKDGKVDSVVLANGAKVQADLVVVGIGARPRTELVREKLQLDHGAVVVDGHFRTNIPDVFAIGDVAHFPLKKYNRSQRMEHVAHARASASHVADVLAAGRGGQVPEYDYLPYFYSRVFDLSWKFYGDAVGRVRIVGNMKPYLLAIFMDEEQDSQERRRINGIFLESGGDETYVDIIKKVAMLRPLITKQQRDKFKFWGTKVSHAMEILEDLVQPPGVEGKVNRTRVETEVSVVSNKSSK